MLPTYAFVPNIVNPWWTVGSSVDLVFQKSLYYDSAAGGPTAVTNLLSISRASIGYAKTQAGTLTQFGNNQLRITDLGLLVEDSRTNLLLQSEDFSTTWVPGQVNAPTVDQAVAPNGTTTMDQIVEDTNNSRHIVYQLLTFGLTADVNHAFSVFIKDVDRRYIQLSFGSTGSGYAYFDLQTGTMTDSGTFGTGATFTSANIEAYANGTYRLSLVANPGNAETAIYFIIALSDRATQTGNLSAGNPSYTGTGKSVYLWGAQVENNVSFPSSYIPTTTTSATRAADVESGINNLQTLITGSAASVLMDIILNVSAASRTVAFLSAEFGALDMYTAVSDTVINLSGGISSSFASGSYTTGAKIACGYNASGSSVVGNGGSVGSNATVQDTTPPIVFGERGSTIYMFGYIRRLTVWNSRLADATLQSLTAP